MSHKMLILNLLGTPEVKLHGNPLPNWVTKKAQALLFYLAVTGQAHTRDEIATLFWPEMADRQARKNLRTVLPELTKSIGDYIKPGNQTIVFNRQLPYQLDVEALRNLFASDPSRSDSNTLRQTMLLYRGEFLKGFYVRNDYTFEEWVRSQREYLQALAVRGFTLLTERYFEQREYALGLEITHRLLLIEPWLESAHRQQMRLLALNGQRSAALTQYRICQEILATEFDATPAAETLALYEQIRTGKWPGVNPLSSTAATVQTNRPAESRPVALPESSEPAKTMQSPLTENLPSSDASNQAHPLPFVQAGNVPVIELFLGRQAELTQLNHWLLKDRCRLAAILGLGGQGKTTLAASLVQHLFDPDQVGADGFQQVLWRSLLNAPPLTEVLQSWLQSLAPQWLDKLPERLDDQLDLLLNCLQQQRCLLVLDNLESILQAGERAGYYRAGYADYGQLIDQVATRRHQSCLLLTSREEPHQLKQLAVGVTRCRTLRLPGLNLEAGQSLLAAARLTTTAEDAQRLVAHYSGNPLALKLIIATIQELFGGNIQMFLATASVIFDDIRDVLDQQFGRLSPMEQQLMYWLAIEREPVSLDLLHKNFVVAQPYWVLLEALRSLQRRSLVELSGELVGLQNVITEYVTARLVAATIQDLTIYNREMRPANWSIKEDEARKGMSHPRLEQTYFNLYALVNAQAKEYVRSTQVRLLLEPVANTLKQAWGLETIATRMQVLLHRLRLEAPLAPGYAAANILHLLLHWHIDLRSYDFSRLALWQADLRTAGLSQVNLAQADLSGTVFLEPVDLIESVHFSHCGQWLVTGTSNGEIQIWRLADKQLERVLKGHTASVYSLAFSPDNSYLVSAGSDRTIRIYDTATGEVQLCLRGHIDEVIRVHLNHADKLVVSISYDGSLKVWDIGTQTPVPQPIQSYQIFAPKEVYMAATAIAPDGRLALVAIHHQIHCWAVSDGRHCCVLEGHTGVVRALAISPDGFTLASAGEDHTIRLWDLSPTALEGGNCQTPRLLATLDSYPTLLAFSANGAALAAVSENHTIRVWAMPTGQLCHLFADHVARVSALAFSPTGDQLASASFDHTIRLRNMHSGQTEFSWHGGSKWLERVLFSPDNQTLAGIYFDCAVRVWTRAGQLLCTLRGHTGAPRHLAYSADGKMLVSGGDDKTIRIWHLPSGEQFHTLRRHTDRISGLAFHPHNALLASLGDDQKVYLWDVATEAQLGQAAGNTQPVFSADGTILGFLDSKQQVWLWQIGSEQPHPVPAQSSSMLSFAFHPHQRWLATASTDKTICLWDLAHDRLLTSIANSVEAYYLRFSATGETLITANLDQTLGLWTVDTATGHLQLCYILPGHIYNRYCIAFSPNGALLVSGNVNGLVQIWDVQTGQCLHTLVGHNYLITTVDFSPDGSTVASGSSNGTLRLWDVHRGVCLQVLRVEAPYAGMNITGVTGVTPAQKAALKALGAVEEED